MSIGNLTLVNQVKSNPELLEMMIAFVTGEDELEQALLPGLKYKQTPKERIKPFDYSTDKNTSFRRLYQIYVDGILVGYTGMMDSGFYQKVAFVSNLYIKPEHRRKGYAEKALLIMKQKAKRSGYLHMGINYIANNPAQILYNKLGFSILTSSTSFMPL